jgi:hypothetical protein
VHDNIMRAVVAAMVAVVPALVVGLIGVGAWLFIRPRPPLRHHFALLLLAAVPGFLVGALVHFGTPGFTLSHLPATLLLALVPAVALQGQWRRLATVALVVVAALGAQRFVAGTSVVPRSISENRYLPGGVTLHEIRRIDSDTRRYVRIRRTLDPERDVLVFVVGNGFERFRPLSLALPAFAAHLLNGSQDAMTALGDHAWFDDDTQLEVPPGGDAVVLLDHDDPALAFDAGGNPAPRTVLAPGVVGVVVPVGGRVGAPNGGVIVVADRQARTPKTDRAHLRPCGGGPC